MRLVDGLNDGSDAVVVVWILSEISIEETDPHYLFVFFQPKFNKTVDLWAVHELNVVDMPEGLCFDGDILRPAG
jgi:hypothetical protein